MSLDLPRSDEVLAAALAEDLGVPAARLLGGIAHPGLLDRDVTSAAVVPVDAAFEGFVVARSTGVVCGLPLVEQAYGMLCRVAGIAQAVEVYPLRAEGSIVAPGTRVAEVSGPARAVLAGERTALNLLMTLSGIASEARRWSEAAGPDLAVLDTRKTLPGLRALSKYAVHVGGASNHRSGLYDMVLVKDNHIVFAGGIARAVAAARESAPGLLVEVEADTLEQAVQAARAGADLVLLDNMDDAALAAAVAAIREVGAETGRKVLTEASGSICLERLGSLRSTGVDRVSTSALTLAAPLDFGLDEG